MVLIIPDSDIHILINTKLKIKSKIFINKNKVVLAFKFYKTTK